MQNPELAKQNVTICSFSPIPNLLYCSSLPICVPLKSEHTDNIIENLQILTSTQRPWTKAILMYVCMYVMYEGPKNLQTQSAWATLPCHGGWHMWTHFHIWCTRVASHQSTGSVKWRSNQQRTVTSWLEASWPGRGTPRCWHRQQGTPPYRNGQRTSIGMSDT